MKRRSTRRARGRRHSEPACSAAGAAGPATAVTADGRQVRRARRLGRRGQRRGALLDECARDRRRSTRACSMSEPKCRPAAHMRRAAARRSRTLMSQLSQLNRGTTVVTLTVGVNDLGLDQVYAACSDGRCRRRSHALPRRDPDRRQLGAGDRRSADVHLIGAIARARAGCAIVVTGYPHLFGVVAGTCAVSAQLAATS